MGNSDAREKMSRRGGGGAIMSGGRDVVGGMWGRAMCVPGQEPVNVFEELTFGTGGVAHYAHIEVATQRDALIGHSSVSHQ